MPLATPRDTAIGPPKLSSQPGKGSLNEDITVKKTARATEEITDLLINFH
jgi:hypothetical protein